MSNQDHPGDEAGGTHDAGSEETEQSQPVNIPASAWAGGVVGMLVLAVLIYSAARNDHRHVGTGGYAGPAACGECHADQFESWGETRMAQAFEVLRAGAKVDEKKLAKLDPTRDYTRDTKCLPCHTTGYGKIGGFVSFEETPQMAGVTCEACHGPGGMYAGDRSITGHEVLTVTGGAGSEGVIYPPDERVCKKCHNDDSPFIGMSYVFDFDERLDKGTHRHYKLKYEPKPKAP